MQKNGTNFLRVLAIVLVINSHLDTLYPPKAAILATGGMIGNALFFMLSGWGLFLSMRHQARPFGEWYGRRITRIYPAVWVTVILLTFPLGIYNGSIRLDNSLDEMRKFFFPPFWFLQALMVYYAMIFFLIDKFSYRRLSRVALAVMGIYVAYYVFVLDLSRFSIEETPFRVIFYFLVMLWGLYLGTKSEKLEFSGVRDVVFLFVSVALIYGQKFMMHRGQLMSWQWVQHLASFPMLYYFAKIAKSRFISETVMGSHRVGGALTFVSAMTLEIFMVNNSIDIIDNRLGPFPFNVIALISINFGIALVVFYCAKPIRTALESKGAVSRPRVDAAVSAEVMAVR